MALTEIDFGRIEARYMLPRNFYSSSPSVFFVDAVVLVGLMKLYEEVVGDMIMMLMLLRKAFLK